MATTSKSRNTVPILVTTFGLLLTTCMAANQLILGQMLGTDQSLTFAVYRFVMQSDCNLVLYDNDNAVWATGTNGHGAGCQCRMQFDGNLVIYNNANQVMWASNTNRGTGNYVLILQRDRNVVIYDPSGRPIWATGTNVLAAANITLSTIVSQPRNITVTTAKLNNIPVTPTEKKTASNSTDITATPYKKITNARMDH